MLFQSLFRRTGKKVTHTKRTLPKFHKTITCQSHGGHTSEYWRVFFKDSRNLSSKSYMSLLQELDSALIVSYMVQHSQGLRECMEAALCSYTFW